MGITADQPAMTPLEQAIRASERAAMTECCNNSSRFTKLEPERQVRLIDRLEEGANSAAYEIARGQNIPRYWDDLRFRELYLTKCYNIKINLDPTSSINQSLGTHHLIDQLCNYVEEREPGIDPLVCAYMTSHQLNPAANQHLFDEVNARGKVGLVQKFSEMYRCAKCQNKKTSFVAKQDKRGDEGDTLHITCLICGWGWRQNH